MKTSKASWFAALSVSVMLAGCSANQTQRPQTARNVLTIEEMRDFTDVYSAVLSLRPLWLRQRGVTSIRQRDGVKVYLDGSLMGGAENLKQITIISIGSVRYLDGLEASNRWGLDHGNGAIMIETRKQ